MTAYQTECEAIAQWAKTFRKTAESFDTIFSIDEALTEAAKHFVADALQAKHRQGFYAKETTTEVLEDIAFRGSVAYDILDGNVSRPSTGNVRAYARNLIIS